MYYSATYYCWSELHTSELNSGISLMYVVHRTSSVRVRAPHTDTMRVIQLETQVVLLLVMNMYAECFQKSSETIAAKTRKTARPLHTREQGSPTCGRSSQARQERLTK